MHHSELSGGATSEDTMDIILYSTGCPRCNVLKKKLDDKNISYSENTNIETMTSLGIEQVPVLSVDGDLMDFSQANIWINQRG